MWPRSMLPASAPSLPRRVPRETETDPGGPPRFLWPRVALAALAALAVAAPLPFLDRSHAVAVFYDDAFYYFQIAREVARGSGFTFDGQHPTNGFHPLWLFVLVPVFRVLGDAAALPMALALQAGLVAVAAMAVFGALQRRIGGAAAAAAALLLIGQPSAARILGGGMEGSLVLCLLVIVWARWLELEGADRAPAHRWWELGTWCALLFLARLESLLAVPILLWLGRRRLRHQPLNALALAAPTAVAAAAYTLWSRHAFGLWVPVSALVKSHLAPVTWSQQPLAARLALALDVPWLGSALAHRLMLAAGFDMRWHPYVSALLLVAAVGVLVWKRATVGGSLRAAGAPFVVLFAVALLVADKIGVRLLHDWYRSPTLLLNAVVVAALLARFPRAARIAVCALVPLALARGGQRFAQGLHPAQPLSPVVEAADWLRAFGGHERIGSWNAGALGYLADRDIIGLDGLVNDAAFFREVVAGGHISEYLARERVRFLADVTFENGTLAPLSRYPAAERAAVEAAYVPRAYLRGRCVGPCGAVTVFERADAR